MAGQQYNGWTNWETWLTALWIGEGLIDEDSIRDAVREHDGDAYAVGKWVEDMVSEYAHEHVEGVGLVSDLVSGCLGSVDWYSIGSHMVEDYAPEVEEVEEVES